VHQEWISGSYQALEDECERRWLEGEVDSDGVSQAQDHRRQDMGRDTNLGQWPSTALAMTDVGWSRCPTRKLAGKEWVYVHPPPSVAEVLQEEEAWEPFEPPLSPFRLLDDEDYSDFEDRRSRWISSLPRWVWHVPLPDEDENKSQELNGEEDTVNDRQEG
jgi:hypothetical protein